MNNQTLAALINKLQAPVIVSDILTGKDDADETHYALSALISDMQPDAAILAIALSMRKIINPYLNASPSLQMTEIECVRLIEDYAHQWMMNPIAENTDPQECGELMEQICDDLEYMEELLDLNINYLQAKDEGGVQLCKLLKAQTSSHHMIAEAISKGLNSALTNEEHQTLAPDTSHTATIIRFPTTAR
jgi:hypothetical protein